MITEDYCSYEVAKLLKEKGFLKDVDLRMTQNLSFYDNIGLSHNLNKWYDSLIQDKIDFVVAPTHQMAMKWFREVHNIQIELNWDKGNQLYSFQIWKPRKYQPEISSLDLWRIYKDDNYLGEWKYEQAIEAALKYVLENLI